MVPDVWGVVATANAPLLDIARFCAHHLYEGAEVILFIWTNPMLRSLPRSKLCLRSKSFPLTMHIGPLKERAQRILNRDNLNARDAARKIKANFHI